MVGRAVLQLTASVSGGAVFRLSPCACVRPSGSPGLSRGSFRPHALEKTAWRVSDVFEVGFSRGAGPNSAAPPSSLRFLSCPGSCDGKSLRGREPEHPLFVWRGVGARYLVCGACRPSPCPLSVPVKCAFKGPEPLTLVFYANKTLVHGGLIASLCALVLGGGDTRQLRHAPCAQRELPNCGVDKPAETSSGVSWGNVTEQGLCACGAESQTPIAGVCSVNRGGEARQALAVPLHQWSVPQWSPRWQSPQVAVPEMRPTFALAPPSGAFVAPGLAEWCQRRGTEGEGCGRVRCAHTLQLLALGESGVFLAGQAH